MIFRNDDKDGEEDKSIEMHMVFKIEDVPPANKPKDDKDEGVDMRDINDKPGLSRWTGLGNRNAVVKRKYFSGKGMRVHEFRVG